MPLHIANAGNVVVPVILTLRDKGYTLRWKERPGGETDEEWWYAEGPAGCFISEDPVSLLGLVAMGEHRGDDWKASDEQIDAFLAEYKPGGG